MWNKSFTLSTLAILFTLVACNNTPTGTKDEESPTVSIINPLNNSEHDEGTIITIKAEAADNEGIAKVEFYIDGLLEHTDTSIEYDYEWNEDYLEVIDGVSVPVDGEDEEIAIIYESETPLSSLEQFNIYESWENMLNSIGSGVDPTDIEV